MLPFFFFFGYDVYLKKIFTLNSMADLLEYLERKQPQVGKKPQRLDYPGVFGSSHCSQRLADNCRLCRPKDPSWRPGSEFVHSGTKSLRVSE